MGGEMGAVEEEGGGAIVARWGLRKGHCRCDEVLGFGRLDGRSWSASRRQSSMIMTAQPQFPPLRRRVQPISAPFGHPASGCGIRGGGGQRLLDERPGTTGHEKCCFPLFIPLCYFETEAERVDGFAKDVAGDAIAAGAALCFVRQRASAMTVVHCSVE